jgi:glutamate racemase
VIEPGAQAAAAVCSSLLPVPSSVPSVLVLATAATVQSAAYTRECAALGLSIYEKACPLLVPLVEEGWTDHRVTAEVLRIYLTEALAEAPSVQTLVLGCTHYPLIKPLIERTLGELGHPLQIVDSATATAIAAAKVLPAASSETEGISPTFYATDSIEKFQRLGSAFLGQPLPEVQLIDLGG